MVAYGVGLGHKPCCDGLRDRLRTIMVFWLLQEYAVDHTDGSQWLLGQTDDLGRLMKTGVLWWLQRLAKDKNGGFCV